MNRKNISGLTSKEVIKNREKFGTNDITSKNNNTFVAMIDLLKIQVLKTIPLLRIPHLRSAFLKLDTAFFSPFCYLFVRQINVCGITSPV